MNKLLIPSKKICACTIVNIILVTFILVISFYLIRRLNRVDWERVINLSKNIEPFRSSGGVCKPVIQNKINMNQLAKPLSVIAKSLENIDAKLDFVNGFKTIKEGKGKLDKNAKVPRKNYPDKKNRYKYAKN